MTQDRLNAPATTGRLHALDNLRASMMWLGIVLHVAVIHGEREALLPWRDERRTAVADLIMAFIHAFRMPVFFILGGYFVAHLARILRAAGARAGWRGIGCGGSDCPSSCSGRRYSPRAWCCRCCSCIASPVGPGESIRR